MVGLFFQNHQGRVWQGSVEQGTAFIFLNHFARQGAVRFVSVRHGYFFKNSMARYNAVDCGQARLGSVWRCSAWQGMALFSKTSWRGVVC